MNRIDAFIDQHIGRSQGFGSAVCEVMMFRGSNDEVGEECHKTAFACRSCDTKVCSEHGKRCEFCGTWLCLDCAEYQHECRREVLAIADFLHEHHHIADRPDKGQDCYICVSDARQIEAKRKQALGEVA